MAIVLRDLIQPFRPACRRQVWRDVLILGRLVSIDEEEMRPNPRSLAEVDRMGGTTGSLSLIGRRVGFVS